MNTRVAFCLLALAAVPGCAVYHYRPVTDARQLLSTPSRSAMLVRVRDGSTLTLNPPVELVGDTVFGWHRRPGQDAVLRVGVPLSGVRWMRTRHVDWPSTILCSSGGVLAAAAVLVAMIGFSDCGPICW